VSAGSEDGSGSFTDDRPKRHTNPTSKSARRLARSMARAGTAAQMKRVELVRIAREFADQSGEVRTRKYRMRSYVDVFPGSSLVTWLVEHRYADSRTHGVSIGLAMMLCQPPLVHHVVDEHRFKDLGNLFFRFFFDEGREHFVAVPSASVPALFVAEPSLGTPPPTEESPNLSRTSSAPHEETVASHPMTPTATMLSDDTSPASTPTAPTPSLSPGSHATPSLTSTGSVSSPTSAPISLGPRAVSIAANSLVEQDHHHIHKPLEGGDRQREAMRKTLTSHNKRATQKKGKGDAGRPACIPGTFLDPAFGTASHIIRAPHGNLTMLSESEPSGIIAHALEVLHESGSQLNHVAADTTVDTLCVQPGRDGGDKIDLQNLHASVGLVRVTLEDPSSASSHALVEMVSESFDGPVFFQVRCIAAWHFTALRATLVAGQEPAFIASLRRCAKWETTGGKSGSAFLKTLCDRYVIKDVSKVEEEKLMKSGHEICQYTIKGEAVNRPSCLCRILGAFKVKLRDAGGHERRHRLIVMENIFYGHTITRTFDLKGSSRNRKVKEKEVDKGAVLMDTNLMELIEANPIFVRADQKRLLSACVWNDTLFLSNLQIMDYSLLVGLSAAGAVVVGIIDYLRVYTWDKQLENLVKTATTKGTDAPTVVQPADYKRRFRGAMEKYFITIPDKFDTESTDSHYEQRCRPPMQD